MSPDNFLPNTILIIGGGGREHALAWLARKENPKATIIAAPGSNSWFDLDVMTYPEISVMDFEGQLRIAQEHQCDLIIVGPEAPLIAGIADMFRANGFWVYGPGAKAAQIEASKAFSGDFLHEHKIPCPKSWTFTSVADATDFILERNPLSYVIKASGDAAGKGVVLPSNAAEAAQTVYNFMTAGMLGEAGKTLVIQERLFGPEFSAMIISDGVNVTGCPLVQDHKRLLDYDQGPNTGGMGIAGPIREIAQNQLNRIGQDIVRALGIDNHSIFIGTLFLGCILTKDGVKVLEVNCRWGDPETEALVMLCHQGLLASMYAASQRELLSIPDNSPHYLWWDGKTQVATIVLAAEGYPNNPRKGDLITGLDSLFFAQNKDCQVFHMGVKFEKENFYTNGGRVIAVSARAQSYEHALTLATTVAYMIDFQGKQMRTDIGESLLVAIKRKEIRPFEWVPAEDQ
jgi:phosphoribosylamine--glycine ligase